METKRHKIAEEAMDLGVYEHYDFSDLLKQIYSREDLVSVIRKTGEYKKIPSDSILMKTLETHIMLHYPCLLWQHKYNYIKND